tara:strand:+ start:31052 stop:31642 length:591 start_codon:yes stop_codon:yes gene_type:complete
VSNIFNKLELQAFKAGITPRTTESRKWFQNKIKNMRNINRDQLMSEEPIKKKSDGVVGNMYMFTYDPKHKETLPYYDTFPLVIVIGPAKGGFLGLNLHYLPPILRAKLLDGLMGITTNKSFNATTKFKLSYEMLQGASSLKYYEPCLKHYLNSQVTSKFALVPSTEWEIATFLPTANFRGANSFKVYADSKKALRG